MAVENAQIHIDVRGAGYVDSDDDQPMAEKDLAGDAEWKISQRNTFTRWVNEHLKKVNMSITDLETELSDGLRLIALVELLANHKFVQYNRKPNFRTQKLENVTMVLKFLEENERLRLVSIGPKQRLLNWIKMKLLDQPVKNFTTDWNSGVLIGSLVDACASGLCPDWPDWDSRQGLKNATEAMTLADEWLSIPQLVRPDEIINPKVDEKAMMTYLSQFPNAELKKGAPLRPRKNPTRVKAYGQGLDQSGVSIGKEVMFTVETYDAGRGNLEVILLNPKGAREPCDIVEKNDKLVSYACSYKPRTEGQHRVIIKFAGEEIPNSPFRVDVAGSAADPSKVNVSGPGVGASGNSIGRQAQFSVFTKAAGRGNVNCLVIDPSGRSDVIRPNITSPDADGTYLVEYTPKELGNHQVFVNFDGEKVPNAPFFVMVGPPNAMAALAAFARASQDPIKFNAPSSFGGKRTCGDFIQPHGPDVTKTCKKLANTETEKATETLSCPSNSLNGNGHLMEVSSTLLSASGDLHSAAMHPKTASHMAIIAPIVESNHKLDLVTTTFEPARKTKQNGTHLNPSNHHHNGHDEVQRQMTHNPEQEKTTNGETRVMSNGHTIANGDDGESISKPLSNGRHDTGLNVSQSARDLDLAYVTGRGVQMRGIRAQDKVSFEVHTEKCSEQAPVSVTLTRSDGGEDRVSVTKVTDTRSICQYVPQRPGKYTVNVKHGDMNIRNSPFEIVVGPHKNLAVDAFGPGLYKGVVGQPNQFTVSCREQGSKMGFSIEGPSEARMECSNNGDGSACVTYWVNEPGEYAVHVLYADEDIGNSPYMPIITTEPRGIEVKQVKLVGAGKTQFSSVVTLDRMAEFELIGLKEALQNSNYGPLTDATMQSLLQVECYDPVGKLVPVKRVLRSDGTVQCAYTPKTAGVHTMSATLAGISVGDSPLRVNAARELSQNATEVWGPGVKDGVYQSSTYFMIDPLKAIPREGYENVNMAESLSFDVTDNMGRPIETRVSPQNDGTFRVDYDVDTGVSQLEIVPKLCGMNLFSSPIKVSTKPAVETEKLKVQGLDSRVDPSLFLQSLDVPSSNIPIELTRESDGLMASFTATELGRFELYICSAGNTEPTSHFVSVTDAPITATETATTEPLLTKTNGVGSYKAEQNGVSDATANKSTPMLDFTPTNESSLFVAVDLEEDFGESILPEPLITVIDSDLNHISVSPSDSSENADSTSTNTVYAQKESVHLEDSTSQVTDQNGIEQTNNIDCSTTSQCDDSFSSMILTNNLIDQCEAYDVLVGNTSAVTLPQTEPFGAPASVDDASFHCTDQIPTTDANLSSETAIPETMKKVNGFNSDCSNGYHPHKKPIEPQMPTLEATPFQIWINESGNQSEAFFDCVAVAEPISLISMASYTSLTSGENEIELISNNGNGVSIESSTVDAFNDSQETGLYPPRPFVTAEEKAQAISRSLWQQPKPDQPASQVIASGPGLERAMATETAHFAIDSRNAPVASLKVTITGPSEANVHCVDNGDGTCSVSYDAPQPGRYVINVIYDDVAHIHQSPFLVPMFPPGQSDLRTDDVRTFGFGSKSDGKEVYKSAFVKFEVDASTIDPKGNGEVTGILTTPNKERVACQVTPKKDGIYACSYTPMEEGPHTIELSYNGAPLPGSPFQVNVVPGCDPKRVKAYGPGLTDGLHLIPGQQTEFTVELTGAGPGGLGLAVEGPSEAPIECRDNRDGTCTVFYTPMEPGAYSVFVRFNETNVPNSPFNLNIQHQVDSSRVQCYGPALESGPIRASTPAYFTVDTKKAGQAKLQVQYSSKPGGPMLAAHTQPVGSTVDQSDPKEVHYHKVSFTPESEGPCRVEVLYDGQHVSGSPYTVQVRKSCEPERVRVLGSGVEKSVLASFPATFTVDAREAGMGDLTLRLSDPRGHAVPVRVVPLAMDNESVTTNGAVPSITSLASGDVSDTGLLSCTYEPYTVGAHEIHVMFAGVEVGESPYTVQSMPTGRADLCVLKELPKETLCVGAENVLCVDTASGEKGNLTCQVVQSHTQSGAPPSLLPTETQDNGDGTVSVYYTPKDEGELELDLCFGGQTIPQGRITQKVLSAEEFRSYSKVSTPFRPVEFRLPGPRDDVRLECIVIRPSGTQQSVEFIPNDDDTITIFYSPVEQGMHELHLNGFSNIDSSDHRSSTVVMPCSGSPYRFYVDHVSKGRVNAYGPGLSHGVTNQPAVFTIDAHEAGGGGLSLAVEGPSKAEITCHENGDGTCDVSYLPIVPGKYSVAVKFLDDHIRGSPFVATINDDARKRSHVSMGGSRNISLDDLGENISSLKAIVESPSGREEPCVLKKLPSNRLGISFSPKEVGKHKIHVSQTGKTINNSPFMIEISENEIGDPRRVHVSGPGLIAGRCNEPNMFTVDTRDAGYAGLSLSIEGPSKATIDCHDNHDGTCSVSYVPKESGLYVINVKYADVHVANSPFDVQIGEVMPAARVTERITRLHEAAQISHVGSRCELSLRANEMQLRDMSATVTAPSKHTTPCELVTMDAEHYAVKFIPQEVGEHLVHVKHKGVLVAGSPFQFTVGPIMDGVPNRVRAMGPGLQEGTTNALNEFNIYTREAGAGSLAIAIEGSSKADIDCSDNGDGSSNVTYRVTIPGMYTCSIKFNDEHIPFSPFRIYVSDDSNEERITSYRMEGQSSLPPRRHRGPSDTMTQIGRPVAFTVHHKLSGSDVLRARVDTPSGSKEEAIVRSVHGDEFAIRFVPHENGPHFMHVHVVPGKDAERSNIKLGPESPYRAIPGSPFRLVVSQQNADAGLVSASGEGLRVGYVDRINSFLVNTSDAGSGVLNVTVDGPCKVMLTPDERENGYAFNYVPTVPGEYDINIKFGGDSHIQNSPFKVNILEAIHSGVTDNQQSQVSLETVSKISIHQESEHQAAARAQHVHCEGSGLVRASMHQVNEFHVDAREAGNEILLVGIAGPSRSSEEVTVKQAGDDQYNVFYRLRETGRHVIMVKWGDVHVRGSPFVVEVP